MTGTRREEQSWQAPAFTVLTELGLQAPILALRNSRLTGMRDVAKWACRMKVLLCFEWLSVPPESEPASPTGCLGVCTRLACSVPTRQSSKAITDGLHSDGGMQ